MKKEGCFMTNYLNDLLENLDDIDVFDFAGLSHGGNSIPSMTIVNSKKNGKRLTFSKALSQKLGLTDSVDILLLKKGTIVIAGNIDIEQAEAFDLCDDEGRKIIYHAELVKKLASLGKLDFDDRTSYSFRNISFDQHGDTEIATIDLTKPLESNSKRRKNMRGEP